MASPDSHAYADRLCARLPGWLREVRAARQMSAPELARRSGVTRPMIWRIETGKSIPTLHLIARLTAGLGVTLEELVGALEAGEGERKG